MFDERRRKRTVGVNWRRFQTDILGWASNTSYGDHSTMIGWQARGLEFSAVSIEGRNATSRLLRSRRGLGIRLPFDDLCLRQLRVIHNLSFLTRRGGNCIVEFKVSHGWK